MGLKKIYRTIIIILILLIIITGLGYLLLQPFSQKAILNWYVNKLEKNLGTTISYSDAKISLFDEIIFSDLYIEDELNDTLLYACNVNVDLKLLLIFDPSVQLDDVYLDGAYLNIYKISESRHNFQFLIDEFSSDEPKDTTKKGKGFDLDFDELHLRDFRMKFHDKFKGEFLDVKWKYARLETEDLQLREKELRFETLEIEKPQISFKDLPVGSGIEGDNDSEDSYEMNQNKEPVNPSEPWLIAVNNLQLSQAKVNYQKDKATNRIAQLVDFNNLEIDPLDLTAHDLLFAKDTLTASIDNISLNEISGFKVDQLQTDLELSSKHINLSNLELKTPDSKLGNSINLQFEDFDAFKDFNDKVKLKGSFKDSWLAMNDLAYFVPNLGEQLERFTDLDKVYISGDLRGKISNLRGDNIKLKVGEYTNFDGRIRLRGLPEIETTFIDFKLEKLTTRMDDVLRFFPKITFPKGYEKLGLIDFKGNFTGYPNDFVADGTLNTEIGSVTSDINMKIDEVARYSGELNLKNFDLKTFLDNKDLGLVSFTSDIKGQGLKSSDINATIKGNIETFDFKDYRYKDIAVDGTINQKLFTGAFEADDENFDLNFKGQLDFNNEVPNYKFESEVFSIDLLALNIAKEKILVSGKTKLDLEGTNIDNIRGLGTFENLTIGRFDTIFEIDDFDFYSEIDSNHRSLNLNSELLDAHFEGDFSFAELPKQLKRFLNIYFPYRFGEELASDEPAVIDFGIDIHKEVEFAQLFDQKIKYLGPGKIEGSFNDARRSMELDADVPRFVYDKIELDSITLKAVSDSKAILFETNLQQIFTAGQKVNDIVLEGFVYRDTLDFSLNAEKDEAYNNLRFDGLIATNSDTLSLNVENLDVKVAEKHWLTDTGEFVFYNKDNFRISDFVLSHEDQSLSLSGLAEEVSRKNQVVVDFNEINLEELMQLVDQENLGVKGLANGFLRIREPLGNQIFTGDVWVDDFIFKDQELGSVNLSAEKVKDQPTVDLIAKVESEEYLIEADGLFDMGVVGVKEDDFLDIEVEAKRMSLEFLEGLIGSDISNTTGTVQGHLRVSGNPTAPDLDGELLAYGGGTKIGFLNTQYAAANSTIYFRGKTVEFRDITIFDKFQNTALVNGDLYLNDYKNISVDLEMVSDKFLFLDTKRSNEDVFYGTALAAGVANFTGPFKDISINIKAETTKGSVLYIPVNYSTEVEESNFITFIDHNAEVSDSLVVEEEEEPSDMHLHMDLTVNPDAEVQIIFDYYAGDIIRSRGNGEMQIDYRKTGDFTIFGNYVIDNGEYLFTLQNIINKKFELEKGGTIDFYGDPYDALIDINAKYLVKRTSPSKLAPENLNGDDLENSEENNAGPVKSEVNLNLNGRLASSEISFKIGVPEASPTLYNSALRAIQEMNEDDDPSELNRQVFGLLVFNDYLPPQSLFGNDFIQESITTTVSEFLSNQVTSLLSNTIQQLWKGTDLSFNWVNYESSGTTTNTSLLDDRNEIELVFTKRLFNDRVIIDIGGNVDVGNSSSANTEEFDAIISDFVVQYKITEDGRYYLKVFNKTERDAIEGTFKRAGLSFYLSEEFDNFADLKENFIQRRKARKKRKAAKKAVKAKNKGQ